MIILISIFILLGWLFYKLWTRPYDYWKKKGFPYLKATFPSASSSGLTFMNEFQGEATQDVYNKLAPHPYGGIIVLRRPHLFIRDLDTLKRIMVKDFDYFRDRTTSDNIQEPFSEHLFNLPGEKWRVKRVHLGPIFSASKMKLIFSLYDKIKNDFFNLFDTIADSGEPFNSKDTFSRFSVDFIGSWAFGTVIDSLVHPDHVLQKTGPMMFPPVLSLKIKAEQSLFNLLPGTEGKIRFPFIPPEFADAAIFYTDNGIKEREKLPGHSGTVDLIDTLIKMKNKKTLTTDRTIIKEGHHEKLIENKIDLVFHDLSGEALILFAAGFDTTSSTLSLTLYELTKNLDIQDKLRAEIDEIKEKYGAITYQALKEMKYLDQVVSETLRMYPPVPVLTRYCTRNYSMPDHPERIVEQGTRVIIPVMAIHMDPQLFPDPHVYNPDRFSDENKDNILPFSYIPFGEGPRYCIGKRVGLIQSKMGVALTLSRYKVFKTPHTPEKIKFEPTLLVLTSKAPLLLKLERRNPIN